MPKPSVFLSYSHKDESWKDRLAAHLHVLEEQGLLETWDDRRIRAGMDWQAEINGALQRAEIAVLLISKHSLTSRFILDTEVRRLLERGASEGIHVLPVIVSSCTWKQVPWLGAMQLRPRGGRALASFKGDNRDRELVEIAEEVLELLKGEVPPKRPLEDEGSTSPVVRGDLMLSLGPREILRRASDRPQQYVGTLISWRVRLVSKTNLEGNTVRLTCYPRGERALGNIIFANVARSAEIDLLARHAVFTLYGRIAQLTAGGAEISEAVVGNVESYGRLR